MVTIADKVKWTSSQIAALSDLQLANLSYDEMVRIVLDSGVPLRDRSSVGTMETDSLVRLMYWARQICRSQTS